MSKAETVKKVHWRPKRYIVYIIATVVALVLPWIKVNGNHFFLLSFDKMKLHLAFVPFDMQELYLMPFLLMILFISIFGMTVFGGRMFCGWICPQTTFRVIYRDLIETKLLKLRKSIKNKQKEPDWSKPENKVKRVIAILLWTCLALLAAADFMWYFVPPEDFFKYLQNPSDHMVMIGFVVGVAAFLVADIVFIKENFCIYVCPYSRVQSVLYDEHTIMAIYDEHRGGKIYDEQHHKLAKSQKEVKAINGDDALCTACESCVKVCPTHIDIREGLQLECINCLECVDACTDVMAKFNEPTLVKWSSEYETLYRKGKTHYLRPKIIGYIIVLIIIMGILAAMAGKKEYMLLNINKGAQAYSIKTEPRGCELGKDKDCHFIVENAYKFLVQNTQNEKMKFYFDVKPDIKVNGKIEILKPRKPFTVVPGIKKKKIVVFATRDMLVNNKRDDAIIPVTVHAYALDKDGKPSKKISVYRKARFIFPRADILKK
ncbi:Type cbb3 cytochrome oxidase biogenesis protein CcoG, involved in Cu oxidation [hydrothermal vent metagenome]|uniref:Type cbb3 cytochrome oxidase biogenesis protein CcoG, involved in Cu oxidation n=1 Tax=hydrothermal vent metagenome TaxID=652676 RepID=A0A1W1BFE7_9ZZZZ